MCSSTIICCRNKFLYLSSIMCSLDPYFVTHSMSIIRCSHFFSSSRIILRAYVRRFDPWKNLLRNQPIWFSQYLGSSKWYRTIIITVMLLYGIVLEYFLEVCCQYRTIRLDVRTEVWFLFCLYLIRHFIW